MPRWSNGINTSLAVYGGVAFAICLVEAMRTSISYNFNTHHKPSFHPPQDPLIVNAFVMGALAGLKTAASGGYLRFHQHQNTDQDSTLQKAVGVFGIFLGGAASETALSEAVRTSITYDPDAEQKFSFPSPENGWLLAALAVAFFAGLTCTLTSARLVFHKCEQLDRDSITYDPFGATLHPSILVKIAPTDEARQPLPPLTPKSPLLGTPPPSGPGSRRAKGLGLPLDQ